MVTVSSNEELVFAIELFTGSVLRLNVNSENNTQGPRRCHKGGECRPRNGERWHQKLQANPELLAQKIDRFTQKRDQLRNRLESNKQNGPHQHNRWNPEKKLERVENRLANLQSLSAKQNNPSSEPCHNGGEGRPQRNGEFWRERWHQKLQANPELLAQKIDKLTKKRDWLRNRLDSNKHNGPRQHNRWNPEKKLEMIETRLTNLQSLSAKQNNPSSEPSQCSNPGSVEQTVATPSTTRPLNVDELAANLTKAKYLREQQIIALADVKMKMQAKKQDIQQIRAQAKAECIPKAEMLQRIAPLQEEIKTIRETLQERKAELQASNQNILAVRKALKEKQNA